MKIFNDREKYCISLLIANGGIMDYYDLRDIILEYNEGFSNVKHVDRAVKRTIVKLIDKGEIDVKDDSIKLNPVLVAGFIQNFYSEVLKAIENYQLYGKNNIMEFNARDTLRYFKDEIFDEHYFLIKEITEAYNIYQMTKKYNSVITSCGRCVELMVQYINEECSLNIKESRTRSLINKIKNNEFIQKMEKEDKDRWYYFLDGCNIIYQFRNKMGAHMDYYWGDDQIAHSCLIMTFYFIDYFVTGLFIV